MNKKSIAFFFISFFLLSASSAQEPDMYQNPYAYKNYSCKTPQGRQSGYGRVSEDKKWILFQEEPDAEAVRYPIDQCDRINIMKIQKEK